MSSAITDGMEKILQNATNPVYKKKLDILFKHLEILGKYMEKDAQNTYGNPTHYEDSMRVISQLAIIANCFSDLLPEHKSIIGQEFKNLQKVAYAPTRKNVLDFLEHGIDLLELDSIGEEEIEQGNIFLGIGEKLQRAQKSAEENNPEGLFSCLHTAIEILFKDKLGIALSMREARLGKVIHVCMENEVFEGQRNILKELDEKVCQIDNDMKHKSYNPKAREMNEALMICQRSIKLLKDITPKINDDILEKISKNLVA